MFTYITASAGSGKTYALTRYYLDLLAQASDVRRLDSCGKPDGVFGWPEILAVTFTNKAAAEMKERVLGSLKDCALGLDETGPAREWTRDKAMSWLTVLIRSLGSLNIRTIDSLLHMLVRLSALQLGLSPSMEAVFSLDDVFTELFERVVARAESQDPQVDRLLRRSCESALSIGMRKGFNPSKALQDKLKIALALRITDGRPFLSDTDRLYPVLESMRDDMRDAASRLLLVAGEERLPLNANFSSFLVKCRNCNDFSKPPSSRMAEKGSLRECVLARARDMVGPDAEGVFQDFMEAYWLYSERRALLTSAIEYAPLSGLAELLLEELEEHQRTHGQVLAMRWPDYARRILEEGAVSEAFCRMGNRLRHILMDEFQDTSRVQWEALSPLALEALSRNGDFCYVGDVKQSIYSWRGGDPSLFSAIPEQPDILAVSGPPERRVLEYNWRSAPLVVEFNNRIFGALSESATAHGTAAAMLGDKVSGPALDRLAQSILQAFAEPVQRVPEHRLADAVQGFVRLERIEARTVPDLMEQVRERLRSTLVEDILARRNVGDVAILVRSNKQAGECAQWLVDWGVPVITENSLRLADNPVVKQLLALFRFLENPADDLALWTLLSGRELFLDASGLTVEQMRRLLVSRDAVKPLYVAFRETWPELWDRFLAPFHSRAGFMTPYEMAWKAITLFDVLARHPEQELFVRRFLENIHNSGQQGGDSLSSFLDFWERQGDQERAPLPEHMDAVTISTIHKAKGLEFPVVIVPFHSFGMAGGDDPVVVEPGDVPELHSAGAPMIAAPSPALGRRYEDMLVSDAAEQLNLLYVAWTRPREELHAFLSETPRSRGPSMAALGILLGGLELDKADAVYELGQRSSPHRDADGATRCEDMARTPLFSSGNAPARGPRLKIFRHSFDPLDYNQRQRGILAHRCLERLHLVLSHDSEADPGRAAAAAVEGAMRFPAARYEDAEAVAEQMRSLLTWLLDQPDMVRLLASGRAEQPVVTAQGDFRRMDMVCRIPGRAVVLEYKTGDPSPDHTAQLREYMELLGEALDRGDDPVQVEGRLVYLDHRRIASVLPDRGRRGEGGGHADH